MFIFKWTFLSFVPICTRRYRIHNQFFITARAHALACLLASRKHILVVTVNRQYWAVSLTMTLFDLSSSSSKSECATINMRVLHLVSVKKKQRNGKQIGRQASKQSNTYTCHHFVWVDTSQTHELSICKLCGIT